MHGFRQSCLRAALIGLSTAVSCLPKAVPAQEIAPYRLTEVEGNTTLRYLGDDQTSGQTGGVQAGESRATFQEEINIFTHGYVYHPNFLKVDLGGGPMFVQNRLETDTTSKEAHDTLYNFSTRLTLLEQKPYPLVLFYDHLNPTVSLGLTDTLTQTTDKYGANFLLRNPDSSVGFNANAFRLRSEGQGFNTILDDKIEQATFRLYSSLGVDNYGQLSYQWNRQESLSGSLNLPIQPSTSTTSTAGLDTRSVWGEQQQFRLTQNLTYTEQDYFILNTAYPARRDWRFMPDLRWQHSETLNSFYRYNYSSSTQGLIDTTNQSAAMGLGSRREQGLSAADVHGASDETTGLQLRSYGVGTSLNYRRPVAVGSLQLSYGAVYDRREREAEVAQVTRLDERIILSGVIPVTLANDFVVTGSVVVSNLTRTQTYVEGLDYRLIVIGTKTQVQRLAGGNIVDGQEVLVDYAFETGGSAVYTLFDQSAQANLTMLRYYNLYIRYRDAAQTLVSGLPTLPLNSVKNTVYGARMDVPFRQGLLIGGEVSVERNREDIAPYSRRSYDAYVQYPLPFLSTLRITGRRVWLDYETSPEGVDLAGYAVQLNSRPWFRTTLTADATYDEDTGGSLLRRYWSRALMMEWRIRKVTLRAEGRYSREAQGDFERDRTMVRALLKREF